MNKISRLLIILILFFLSSLTLVYYFFSYNLNPFELNINRIIILILFNLVFYILVFLIDINYFKQIYKIVLLIIISQWIFEFSFRIFNLNPCSYYYRLWELNILLTFSILTPGLLLFIIYYIIMKTAKHNNAGIRKYHIHEGFVGVIFTIIAIILLILRGFLVLYGRFSGYFKILLAINQIILFFFMFFGSFLIFRDWHDIVRFKFIETKKNESNNIDQDSQTSIFNHVTHANINFFEIPKLTTYPFGMLLTILGTYIIGIASGFVFKGIFSIYNEDIIYFGYLCVFLSGGLIGRDWLRVFKKISPNHYQEIEFAVNNLKKRI